MKTLAPFAAIALFAAPAAAQDLAPADAIGTWMGTLETPGGSLRVVFDLTDEDGDGTLEGTGYSPDQGGGGIPLDGIALENDVLTVAIPAVGASYQGTWNGEAFVGTFTQGGELPMTLERTDWSPDGESAAAD